MNEFPHAELLRSSVQASLEENINTIRAIFNLPQNEDVILRQCRCMNFEICMIYVEGMADAQTISEFILHACKPSDSIEIPSEQRADALIKDYIEIPQSNRETRFSELANAIVNGLSVVLIEDVAEALILETRGYPHRNVDKPANESVVIGAQEGFVENLRTNITLVRRYVRSSELITELYEVGSAIKTNVALVYLNGVVDDNVLQEARRRLLTIQSTSVQGIGSIQQHIEDQPNALFPQMLQTERPDRAASCLLEGQFLILADNSPYALAAPITLFHLMHASDDTFMRWQYASLLRVIRFAGIALSLILPGLYIALTLHHTHLVPLTLLLSIAETRANVPFSILAEILMMEFAFYLINEASTRIPSQIGSAISIVGALILGQAAVSASIISPILIIIVALTGLGSYAIPNYGVSLGIVLYRILLVICGAVFGLYGLLMMLAAITVHLCSIRSFGFPYLAPIAPKRPHNPDILLRLPIFRQKRLLYFAKYDSWLRNRKENAL